jgi:hypothetical protein
MSYAVKEVLYKLGAGCPILAAFYAAKVGKHKSPARLI